MRKLWPVSITLTLLVFAWAGSKRLAPRSDASQYPSHAEQGGINIGAKLLTSAEVRKMFAADLNRCCVVVEFAIFPDASKAVPVSLDDIILRLSGSETSTKASGPALISAALKKSPGQQRDVSVHGETGVGFEIGPYERGTYKESGVGVGVDPHDDQPRASDKVRPVIETELREKGLPEGESSKPVAGYVYFQVSPKKNTKYQLQYTVNGSQMNLNLQ